MCTPCLRTGVKDLPGLYTPRGRGDLKGDWPYFEPLPAQSRSEGGGVNPGPIWPCLALFTPTVEAGNGATVASFGPPLTRRRWASRPWLWPWLASAGVARSGETFNSVAFGCIQLHFPFSEPSSSEASAKTGTSDTTLPPLRPVCAPLSRTLDSSLRWNDGGIRGNDVCDQCKGWGSHGAMGSCRLGWAVRLRWRDLWAVREPPLHPDMGQGCEVPVCTGTTTGFAGRVCSYDGHQFGPFRQGCVGYRR